mmetsp:Transcript_30390/g.97177  ORF Transcript_30390/g.97177 Transcript_30390/m.97177 type:complete len:113 (-) Transcript_30390:324-662(-)
MYKPRTHVHTYFLHRIDTPTRDASVVHVPLSPRPSPRSAYVAHVTASRESVYAFFFFAEPLALFSWAGAAADVSAVDALLANSVPFRNLPRSTPAANHAINISHVVGLAMFS